MWYRLLKLLLENHINVFRDTMNIILCYFLTFVSKNRHFLDETYILDMCVVSLGFIYIFFLLSINTVIYLFLGLSLYVPFLLSSKAYTHWQIILRRSNNNKQRLWYCHKYSLWCYSVLQTLLAKRIGKVCLRFQDFMFMFF